MRKLLVACVALGAMSVTVSHARSDDSVSSAMSQMANTPKPLVKLIQSGVRLTHIGNELGLDGYMAQSRDNHLQSIYVNPQGAMVAGILFDADGHNVTAMQIARMEQRIQAAQVEAHQAGLQANQVGAGMGLGGMNAPDPHTDYTSLIQHSAPPIAPIPTSPPAPTPAALSQQSSVSQIGQPYAPPAAQSQAPLSLKDRSDTFISPYDKDTFLADVSHTGYFSFESRVKDVPTVIMVADPKCVYCHRAWPVLRQLALDNRINIRVILASVLTGEGSVEAADALLSNPNVDRAWLEGQGSTDDTPVMEVVSHSSAAWQHADEARQKNTAFAMKYIKKGTPFLAYVGRDGRLRSAEGPNDMAGFLGDI